MQDKKIGRKLENSNNNIFVLSAPGLGGHHISNLLSTDTRFIQRADLSDYTKHLKNNTNAHIRLDINDNLIQDNDKNRVFPLHIGMLLWDYEKIKKFKNRKILIVEFPDSKSSLAYKRFVNYNRNFDIDDYTFHEQKLFYSQHIIEKLVPEKDFFITKSEDIFNDNFDLFYNLTLNMNLKINYDMCKVMHSMWFQKIKKSI